MPDEAIKLDTYRQLNEDEFEFEEITAPGLPGPKMLDAAADELERQARILRDLATLWRSSL